MTSRRPSRGRTLTRSPSPAAATRARSPSRGRSPSRIGSKHSRTPSRSPVRSIRPKESLRRTRSRSSSHGVGDDQRRYRNRSIEQGEGEREKSAKVGGLAIKPWGCADEVMVQIVVEKLSKNVTEAHLREIFEAYGSVRDIELPMNRQCKSSDPFD